MLKEEFLMRIQVSDISPEDYKLIDFVYTWHPSIDPVGGKDEIAAIYNIGGMRIIRDMLKTAERAQEIEDEQFYHKKDAVRSGRRTAQIEERRGCMMKLTECELNILDTLFNKVCKDRNCDSCPFRDEDMGNGYCELLKVFNDVKDLNVMTVDGSPMFWRQHNDI